MIAREENYGEFESEMLFHYSFEDRSSSCVCSGSMMLLKSALSICNFPEFILGIEDNLKLLRSDLRFSFLLFWVFGSQSVYFF